MNLVGLTAEPVCPTGRKMEPLNTQNTQKGSGAEQDEDNAFDN
jgi:hypothetical protein